MKKDSTTNRQSEQIRPVTKEKDKLELQPYRTPDDVTDRRRKTIINIVYWALTLILIYVIFRYAVGYVAPFAIGFFIAMMLQSPITWLSKKTKLKPKISSVVVVAIFYCTIGLLLIIGIISLISNLISWIPQISDLYYKFEPELMAWLDTVSDDIQLLEPNIAQVVEGILDNFVDSLGTLVLEMSSGALKGLSNFLASIPGYFVNLLFTIISTFFFATDYNNITGFLLKQLPERPAHLVREFKTHFGSVIFQFVKSYSLILAITFAELLVGFLILGVNNALIWAIVIAIFDILPIVGVGAALIPWAIIMLIGGNLPLGIGLLVLYLFIVVVRNVIEPKIVGSRVGLNPVVTLVSMFIGAKLFGIIGLFGLPICLSILKSLHDKGAIKLYKE